MSDPLESVKELSRQYQARAEELKDSNPKQSERFSDEARSLNAICSELEDLRRQTQPVPRFNGEDISDLPPELLKELNITKADDIENQLYTIINSAGGEADIDTILIGLYRRYNKVGNRRYIGNRLWRMTQKEGILWSVPNKKGCYTTIEPLKPRQSRKTDWDDEFSDEEFEAKPETNPFELDDDDEIPF